MAGYALLTVRSPNGRQEEVIAALVQLTKSVPPLGFLDTYNSFL